MLWFDAKERCGVESLKWRRAVEYTRRMSVPNFGQKTCGFQDLFKLCGITRHLEALCYSETLDVTEIEFGGY